MNSTPRPPYRPRASPYGHGSTRHGFSPPSLLPLPRPITPIHSYSPSPRQYISPPMRPFPPPPPWSGRLPSPGGQNFTASHLPSSPLSTSSTPYVPYGTPAEHSGQTVSPTSSFYIHSDMPSPMRPPQKRKRFTPIRGRSGGSGRRQNNRPFRGGRARGRAAGIDAYYDPFMFEDPWRDLLPSKAEATLDEGESSAESQGAPNEDTDEPGGSVAEAVTEVKTSSPPPCTASWPSSPNMCTEERNSLPVTWMMHDTYTCTYVYVYKCMYNVHYYLTWSPATDTKCQHYAIDRSRCEFCVVHLE